MTTSAMAMATATATFYLWLPKIQWSVDACSWSGAIAVIEQLFSGWPTEAFALHTESCHLPAARCHSYSNCALPLPLPFALSSFVHAVNSTRSEQLVHWFLKRADIKETMMNCECQWVTDCASCEWVWVSLWVCVCVWVFACCCLSSHVGCNNSYA